MDWSTYKTGHLITSLCARILQSTKEDNVMFDKKLSSQGKVPVHKFSAYKETVKGIQGGVK